VRKERRISVEEREASRFLLRINKSLISTSLGYGIHGEESYGRNAVVWTPKNFIDDGHMVDEIRMFIGDDGKKEISCASVMALKITDSRVRFHSVTLATCLILSGEGRMVLDNEVIAVGAGDMILLPPGVQYGTASDDPRAPVIALITFTPGLAPETEPEHRDEELLSITASQRIRELTEMSVSKQGEYAKKKN
jgi:mannose-6-phosphate isomerase-like protein (cupin superfamily)